MNRVTNVYHQNARQLNTRVTAQELHAPTFRTHSRTVDGVARDALAFVPSWIYLGMVVLAAAAICVTVNLRGHAELQSAETQFQRIAFDIESLRRTNSDLQVAVFRINSEPAIIERTARARLGMVRPTDIVVPMQSRSSTNPTESFVR